MNFVAGGLILVRSSRAVGVRPVGLTIPMRTPWPVPTGWIRPSHFVERHGLVVIVALGESVVAVGIGASEIEISGEMLVAVLGLALSAELWWTYFGGDDEDAERALRRMTPPAGSSTPRTPPTTGHLLLLGIVADAAALEEAIAHASTRWSSRSPSSPAAPRCS